MQIYKFSPIKLCTIKSMLTLFEEGEQFRVLYWFLVDVIYLMRIVIAQVLKTWNSSLH